jgi:hypothetical protein
MASLAVVPHDKGNVVLRQRGRVFFLVHKFTREVHQVEGDSKWTFHIDPEKLGYIYNGVESRWVDDCFRLGCYADLGDDTAYYIVAADKSKTPLADLLGQGDLMSSFDVNAAPPHAIRIRCAWWLAQRTGAHVWWDLSSLYEALAIATFGVYGVWASHGWPRWCRWGIDKLGLPAQHFAKASTGSMSFEVIAEASPEFRCVSSFGIVGLLARWALCQVLRWES